MAHAHELAVVRRCAEDEAHDLTIECQARGGCKGCVGGSLAVRISDCQPDRAIVVASGGVLRYTHIHTPLDDSTRPLDNSTNSKLHNPQRAGATRTRRPRTVHTDVHNTLRQTASTRSYGRQRQATQPQAGHETEVTRSARFWSTGSSSPLVKPCSEK